MVVELLQFEVGVHGWCTSKNLIKIIICFPADEIGVLMRIKKHKSKNGCVAVHI